MGAELARSRDVQLPVTIGSYISCVSTNYTFATVYKGRHNKEVLVTDKPAHVAIT